MPGGLPGTGKTANSDFIRMQLERNGEKVKWIHAVARPHPVLFFSEASLTRDEYDDFLKAYPHAAPVLNSIAVFRKTTVGIDLLKAEWNYGSVIGDSAFQALKKFDIRKFSPDKYAEPALEKWADFTKKALLDTDTVYILDSGIFQYQIFYFLLKGVADIRLERFVHRLVDIVRLLKPSLLYFFRDNPEAAIDSLEKDCGKGFLNSIWERDKQEPYYQDKHKQFLRDYARGKMIVRLH